jgi:bacillithiol synthase
MKIPLRHYPGMNRFVLDWLEGDERFLSRGSSGFLGSSEFLGDDLPRNPRNSEELRGTAVRGTGGLAAALIASNKQWGLFVREDVERWANGGVALIAGQQVGFAGGPLYTLAKIASLVKLKRELAAKDTPATVFFWLATEDHDFDEVATLNVPVSAIAAEKDVNRQLDLVCIRAIRSASAHAAVGSLPVPEALVAQLTALHDIDRPDWLREGITFRDSFAQLIATLFPKDVVLVDALLPELRTAGAPLLAAIREKRDAIQNALKTRSHELEAAGYRPQVEPAQDGEYTLLFDIDAHGTRKASMDGQSTSALTRPLLQDFVFRPQLFLGGPAEVAYYAQIAPLYEMLGVAMPRVGLRGHVLVAPKRVVRMFERFDIAPETIFRNADEILAEQEPEGVERIRALARDGREALLSRLEAIGQLALPADHSLAGSIQRSIGHIEYHFDKLAERAIKGLVRKDKERLAATRELVAALFPDRAVQDRVVAWFTYWNRYGPELVDEVVANVEPDSAVFTIVGL